MIDKELLARARRLAEAGRLKELRKYGEKDGLRQPCNTILNQLTGNEWKVAVY